MFVLLVVGFNVVVGWVGLFDFGYIVFYEIGLYMIVYFVGVLLVKLLLWLYMLLLLMILFSIVVCLIVGVLLGVLILRLRGDYFAIVTFGFGEIIQILVVNNFGGFTGGLQGLIVLHLVIRIGGFHIIWG